MNFVNGFKKYICPFCYEQFSASQIKFRISDPSATIERDDKLSNYYGREVKVPPLAQRKTHFFASLARRFKLPREIKNATDGLRASTRVCPECHNPLPTSFEKMESKIIAVVGARSSGKTHFITVLIDQIKKHGNELGLTLLPQDIGIDENEMTTRRYKKKYWEPLFNRNEELGQTSDADRDHYPLIYELRSNDAVSGKVKSVYLVFYDTAGENFQSASILEKKAKYVANSSGIIFLFDSFQVPSVNEQLREKGYGIPTNAGAFHDVLDQMNQLLEKKGITGPGKKAKVPFALTFSKIDALIKEEIIPTDMIVNEPSHHELYGAYSKEEVESVSEDIKAMLYNWDNAGFVHDMETIFDQYAYFGVSALGTTPHRGKIDEVTPHRVLDPLIWILDQMNFPISKT